MRIGVDASCFGNKRGFGRFTHELLTALLQEDTNNHYKFFADHTTADGIEFPERVDVIKARTRTSQVLAAGADGRRSIRDIWAMTNAVSKHELDVFFFPAVYSYFPILNRTKILLTVHDMIADRHPEMIFPNSRAKIFWKLKQNAAVRQADRILTVSEYSRRVIAEYFGLSPASISVICEAARRDFAPANNNGKPHGILSKYGIGDHDRFLLYVGGISPHKNLARLVSAFDHVRSEPENAKLKLVLVGDYKDDPFFSAYPALKEQIATMRDPESIVFTGFVPDSDLVRLYNAATVLVFPSLEEGFGLPAIEAMACGTPVIASRTGSLPEVLGEAGRYFDPLDASDIARVISAILTDRDERNSIGKIGLERSKQFTWKRAAADTLKIFEEMAA